MAKKYKFSEAELDEIREVRRLDTNKRAEARLMFQDEAEFGRINKPKYCW